MRIRKLTNDCGGQAMVEYVLLTVLVVVGSMVMYVNGWVPDIRRQLHDVLAVVSLPFP